MCYSTLMMHYLGGCINWANALHAVIILSPPPCPRGPSWKTTGVEPETTCSVDFTFKKWRLNPINPSTPHLSPTCTLKATINRSDPIIFTQFVVNSFNRTPKISQSCQLCQFVCVFLLPPSGDIMNGHKTLYSLSKIKHCRLFIFMLMPTIPSLFRCILLLPGNCAHFS